MLGWLQRLKDNKVLLRKAVNAEGERFEAKSYARLRDMGDDEIVERAVEGHSLTFHAEVFGIKDNGDLSVCVEVVGLPTLFGIKPCYYFHKRSDGSVYY
jgi:hypothetical protein